MQNATTINSSPSTTGLDSAVAATSPSPVCRSFITTSWDDGSRMIQSRELLSDTACRHFLRPPHLGMDSLARPCAQVRSASQRQLRDRATPSTTPRSPAFRAEANQQIHAARPG